MATKRKRKKGFGAWNPHEDEFLDRMEAAAQARAFDFRHTQDGDVGVPHAKRQYERGAALQTQEWPSPNRLPAKCRLAERRAAPHRKSPYLKVAAAARRVGIETTRGDCDAALIEAKRAIKLAREAKNYISPSASRHAAANKRAMRALKKEALRSEKKLFRSKNTSYRE
jgi:hypothetical protein